MIVAPDGYIIDVFGPYEANLSDAAIMEQLFRNRQPLRSYFQEGDVFIVDRGFRDVVSHIRSLGYDIRLPESPEPGKKVLSAEQANRSRLVTKCRWVVESRNGHLKTIFRRFDKVWPNKSVPHLLDDFKIACAILNATRPGIESDKWDGLGIADRMLSRLGKPNRLAALVEDQGLNRKSASFSSIDGCTLEFPILNEADLRLLACGSYQLRQAKSYYAEHIKTNGEYEVQVCKHIGPLRLTHHGIEAEEPMLVRGRIQSRHRSSVRYFIYILLDIDKIMRGVEAILEYTCQCQQGNRTVGCCAHIMTVLWFLGFGRHQSEILSPAAFLNEVLVAAENPD
jgi:hypothetical protein